jgi:hypothetical protein
VLVIRNEQMEAFRKAAMLAFEGEMLVHLRDFSPPLFKTAGDDQMRRVVRLGIERAKTHGLTFRGPVRLYLELMLLFGSDFDTDPQYPWATEVLTNGSLGSEIQRADLLFDRTRDYRSKVAGPDDAYTFEALRKIHGLANQPLAFAPADFASGLLREIARVYPQKSDYLGEDRLETLIQSGSKVARAHGLTTDRGVVLMVILMLAFGHGCAEDPLYPWITRTLTDEAIVDPVIRAKRLETRAVTWLDHVLSRFDESIKS